MRGQTNDPSALRSALLTAGRIDTNAAPADSGQYVVRDLAGQLGSNHPDRVFVTVAHVASNYADRSGIDDEFDYYVRHIPVTGWLTYPWFKPEILRNVVGFQLIGDPTLRIEHPDRDGDGLLDPEEERVGTLPGVADTDGDGAPNGDEWTAGTDPLSGGEYPRIDWAGSGGLRWSSVTGRLYKVQQAALAPPFDWQDGSSASTGTGAFVEFNPDLAPGAAFFRLSLSRP